MVTLLPLASLVKYDATDMHIVYGWELVMVSSGDM